MTMRGRRTAVLLAGLLAGCAQVGDPAPRRGVAPPRTPAVAEPVTARIALPARYTQDRTAYGPEVLEPSAAADDAVVAVVGALQIRKSHVFDRLAEVDPQRAETWVDLLVLDAVVAEQARRFGITVPSEEVEELARAKEEELRMQVSVQWEGELSFEDYLGRQFGLGLEEFRRFLRLDEARLRYRGYVIRYLGLREDRVQVRFIVHEDPALLADVRERVLAGADFAALARKHSLDRATGDDGGLLPPFGRLFRHPIAQAALELEAGAVSEVVPFGTDEGRWALVYCLQRLPARDVTFAEVRDELRKELERRPVQEFENNAFAVQYCRPLREPGEGRR